MRYFLATSIALAALSLPTPAATAQERPISPSRSRALESYAEAYGVTVEEAERRQHHRWAIVELSRRLKAEEAETFGGLYIEHSPAYRVVVLFTRDGADTLARYTQNPIFVPAPAAISRQALSETHERVIKLMRSTGIQYVSSDDIRTGLINVYVADLAGIHRLQQTGALLLPPRVVVHQVASMEPEWGPAAMETRLSYWGVGMPPRDGPIGGAAARLEGVLARLDGCLIVTAGEKTRLQPVFPSGKARWNEAAGTLTFAGKDYREGDRITLGGGGVTSPAAFRREAGAEIANCEVGELFVVVA